MTRHIPVLLEEVKRGLFLQKGMVGVDATLGGGGHARMMLAEVLPTGKIIALDMDSEAIRCFRERLQADELLRQASEEERLVLVQSNYADMTTALQRLGIERVDAILADLGFSSDQIETAERGLSFQLEGPLDMRLDRSTALTAHEIVNTYSEAELMQILREYGDESEAGFIARAIVKRRTETPIETTHELAAIIDSAYPRRKRAQMRIHPATKTFQALRIAVNQEFEHLESFLVQAVERLVAGGRLAVITFHSGEDKRVKKFFQEQARGCICPPNFPICRCGNTAKIKIVTKKPVIASDEETKQNPRARSAKLRVAEKI